MAIRKKSVRKDSAVFEPETGKPSGGSRSKSLSGRNSPTARRVAAEDFDQYLATIPTPARQPLIQLREVILSVVPNNSTEIISYGIPAFKQKKVLVWYGGFAGHCSLYPTAAILDEFKDELKVYTTSKGTVQFPLSKPLPVALIKKLVKARLKKLALLR
jgi:uncharacterized protein YdhG (YjbR/CyaY superfamily)